MLPSIGNAYGGASAVPVTEQQMIMKLLGDGSIESEAELAPLAGTFYDGPPLSSWPRAHRSCSTEFRPPMAYYTTIPVAAERTNPRRWDASKLRELRKRLDSGSCTIEEIDDVASDFLDGEIVDLASDWLGNTVCYWPSETVSCMFLKLSGFQGRPEAVREVFAWPPNCHVGACGTTSCDDWDPQEWDLGCAKSHRVC